MSALIIPSYFCPPISSWVKYLLSDDIVVDIHEPYRKKTFRNRYFIVGANGVQMLSVPLKKGKYTGMSMGEVKISYDEPWARKHVQAIRSAYGKSPFFEYYFDEWAGIMLSGEDRLVELNLMLLNFFNIHAKTGLYFSNSDESIQNQNDGQILGGDKFLLPEKIKGTAYYTQVWQDRFGFIYNLSIIDLLFCCGPESVLILDKIRKSITKS